MSDEPLSRRGLLQAGAAAGLVLLAPGSAGAALARVPRRLGAGGWTWFADPRAVYFAGERRRTYTGWIDRDGDLVVACLDHDSGHVVRSVLHRRLGVDDHNNPALLVDGDGRVTAFYSAHPRGRRLYERRALAPEDITRWGPERRMPTNTPGPRGYTYPNALHLAAEQRTYLFWRGGDWSPAFAHRSAGGPWSRARTLLRFGRQRPYVKYCGDGAGTIHMAYTEGNPGSFANSVYYMRYRDGRLERADGSYVADLAAAPLAPARGERVYDVASTGARAWVWDVAIDAGGRPVIAYVLLPDGGDDCLYVYAAWTAAGWVQHPIINAGRRLGGNYAPGIALDHGDPRVAYLSRRVGGRFVVQRCATADGGATWQRTTLAGPSHGDAIRPVCVRGGGPVDVLWMHGRYVHFTDYRTDIVAHLR